MTMSDQPPVVKVRALSRVVMSFYQEHLERHAGKSCACDKDDPDVNCDLGQSLFRLQLRETCRIDLKV
jgi:hypothetical protein